MTAQQMNVDNIAHNLANANTAGFKTRRAQFQDLMYQNVVQPGAAAGQQTVVPTGLQLGLGTRAVVQRDHLHAGRVSRRPDNPLDMVIQGRGFFQVRRPSGELAYTRAGSFHLDRDGNMVTSRRQSDRAADHDSRGRAADHHRADGTVSYTQPNQTAAQQAGQIQLANFPNPAGLNSLGGNLYLPTDASGDPTVGTPGGQEGLGIAHAGLRRAVERLGGRGVHQPDRGAARL